MKISVDDVELLRLSETQKKVIQNDVHEDIFEQDMKRRVEYILMHKYEQCFKRLKGEWDEKFRALGVASIPTDPDVYAQVVFSRPEYKNRKQRDALEIN